MSEEKYPEAKLTNFLLDGQSTSVNFVETKQVKEGVECDIYTFESDTTKDLAIVRVKKGYKTPLQQILRGDKTVEGLVDGAGTLTVQAAGHSARHSFRMGQEQDAVVVEIGQIMQWYADGETDLTFYEICEPPYQPGRFKDLPE